MLQSSIEDAFYSTGQFLTDECEGYRLIVETVPLIAAAPEMYEALECIETAIGYAKEMSANYVLEKQDVDLILSALAKARGENTNQPQG